jgi:hypothetical protein
VRLGLREFLATLRNPPPVRKVFTGAQLWGVPWFGPEAIDPNLQEDGQAKAAADLEHVRQHMPPKRGS